MSQAGRKYLIRSIAINIQIKNVTLKVKAINVEIWLFLTILFFNYATAAIERDIYVPGFPAMLASFLTTPDMIQLTLSVNFIAIFLGTLVYGAISDVHSRKKLLLIGLCIFTIGSLGCVYASTIEQLIAWRFIQGLGSAAPITFFSAILFDRFDKDKATHYFIILNGTVTAVMACAPMIGSFINLHLGWRAIFFFIFLLSLLSLLMVAFCFKEPLDINKKGKLHLSMLIDNYQALLRNKLYMLNILVASLTMAAIIVYVSNLSILFVNHLGVSNSKSAFYQSKIMATFFIGSLICPRLLTSCGKHAIKVYGMLTLALGGVMLIATSFFFPQSALIISLCMMTFSAGAALVLGLFVGDAMSVFPDMKGTASALFAAFRLLVMGLSVYVAGKLFNGTIMPVASIIGVFTLVCLLSVFILNYYTKSIES